MRTSFQIERDGSLAMRAYYAKERFERFEDCLNEGDAIAALRTADSFAAIYGNLIADLVQTAYNDGHTKAEIARALGVNPSTFRGMVRT